MNGRLWLRDLDAATALHIEGYAEASGSIDPDDVVSITYHEQGYRPYVRNYIVTDGLRPYLRRAGVDPAPFKAWLEKLTQSAVEEPEDDGWEEDDEDKYSDKIDFLTYLASWGELLAAKGYDIRLDAHSGGGSLWIKARSRA